MLERDYLRGIGGPLLRDSTPKQRRRKILIFVHNRCTEKRINCPSEEGRKRNGNVKKKKSLNFAVCYNTRDMHDKLLHGYYTSIKYRWFVFSLPLMYTINRSCHSQWQQLGARTITQMLRECCAFTIIEKNANFWFILFNILQLLSRNLCASNNLHANF